MAIIDLNCDMGESFGAWKMGSDAAIMPFISSANIACGFHAGDPTTVAETVRLAIENSVAVGAHPSYPDKQGFGRRAMTMAPKEVYDLVLYQVSAVKGVCESLGGRLHHVKPHGALYNQAAKDKELAAAISEAVAAIDGGLFLYGLSGSLLVSEGENAGLRTASEVFADRGYMDDGSLAPRSRPDALVKDPSSAAARAVKMSLKGKVMSVEGNPVRVRAETICIHGDGARAVEFAQAISRALAEAAVEIKAP